MKSILLKQRIKKIKRMFGIRLDNWIMIPQVSNLAIYDTHEEEQ